MISFPRNTNVILNLVPETDADQVTREDETQQDSELRTRVISFLAESHMPGLRHLRVDACNGVVTISGKVKTFYEKQVGGQRARRVAGVVKFIDRIDVAQQESLAAAY
jgi:osmotically-inducible protein OsmY